LAGSGTLGFADGNGSAAQFFGNFSVACDRQDNVYVADDNNNRIRKITPAGVVSTLAGSTGGLADGTGSTALFNKPIGVACDAQGNVYVADRDNNKIRKITPSGTVSTLAGSVRGYADGPGSTAGRAMRSRATPVTASIETWPGRGLPMPGSPRPGCPEPPPVTRTASISCQVASRGDTGADCQRCGSVRIRGASCQRVERRLR